MLKFQRVLPLNSRRHRASGDEAMVRGDWSEAALSFKKHLARNPSDFAILVQLGHALKETGDYAGAAAAYSKAAAIDPSDWDLALNRGHLAKIRGFIPEALAYYSFAAVLAPDTRLKSDILETKAHLERLSPTAPAKHVGPVELTDGVSIGSSEAATAHEIKRRTRSLIRSSSLFDAPWYLSTYRDHIPARLDPVEHYIQFGASAGLNPCAHFHSRFYSSQSCATRRQGLNPLAHYIALGDGEGLWPNPYFDPSWWRHEHGVTADAQTALEEFLASPDRQTLRTRSDIDNYWVFRSAECQLSGSADAVEFLSAYPEFLGEKGSGRGVKQPDYFAQFVNSNIVQDPGSLPPALMSEAATIATSENPLVSIIMPTWNRADIICRAIDSVLSQSYSNFELVIVDDGSSDQTDHIIQSIYAREIASGKIVFVRQPNSGVCAARNRGLDTAKGDLIAYADSDNAWKADALMLLVAGLFSVAGATSAYGAIEVHEDQAAKPRIVGKPYNRIALLKNNFIDLNAFVHKAKIGQWRPRFDTSLTRLVDWALIIAATKEHDPVFIPAVLVEYYLSSTLNNITATKPLASNFARIKNQNIAEYYRSGIVSSGAVAQGLLGDSGELSGFVRPDVDLSACSLAIVVDDDAYDQFSFEIDRRDFWFASAVLKRSGDKFIDVDSGEIYHSTHELQQSVFYWTTSPARMLSPTTIYNAFLSIALGNLDVALVSHAQPSKKSKHEVAIRSIRDQILVSKHASHRWLTSLSLPEVVRGRVIRLETDRMGLNPELRSLDEVLGGAYKQDANGAAFWTSGSNAQIVSAMRFRLETFPVLKIDAETMILLGMKTAVGGVERLTSNLGRAWKGKYQTLYLALEPNAPDQGDLTSSIAQKCTQVICGGEIVDEPDRIRLLRLLSEAYRPRAVYVMNGSNWLSTNARAFRDVFSSSTIVDQQVYDAEQGWINHYNNPGIRSFDKFVAVNSPIRRTMIEKFGIDPDKISYIPHGHDTARITRTVRSLSRKDAAVEFGLDADKRVLIFAGRMVGQKRPMDFLELAKRRLGRATEQFVLLGDGALASACQEFIAAHRLHNVVQIKFVPDVSRIFRAADALVVTSEYEALPLVVVEAVCMGLPVASTDVGEIRHVLEKYNAGIGDVEPGDMQEMSDTIDEVLKTFAVDFDAAASARRDFSISRMAKLYERASAGKKSS